MKNLIRKILRESDDFDWVRDISAGIKLEPNRTYYIDCGLTGFDEDIFLNKLIELFGDGDWVRRSFSYYEPFNWFNNDVLRNSYPNGECTLILHIGRDFNFFEGGYNPPSYFPRYNNNVLTPEQFLNSWL